MMMMMLLLLFLLSMMMMMMMMTMMMMMMMIVLLNPPHQNIDSGSGFSCLFSQAMHVCHVCMYVSMHVFMYVCMNICMYVCMYLCMYAWNQWVHSCVLTQPLSVVHVYVPDSDSPKNEMPLFVFALNLNQYY